MDGIDKRRYRVLYVEDQPEMIELVRLTLRKSGCDVYGVTDGIQALQMMRELRPDLVLLDLMLPGWDGWQVRKEMLNDSTLRSVPVILVTARVANARLPFERQLPHADAYVTKPFSLMELRAAVQSILDLRRSLAA
jgi:CheY-like chemotaxis protein